MYFLMNQAGKILGVLAVILYALARMTDIDALMNVTLIVLGIALVLYGLAELLRRLANRKNPITEVIAIVIDFRTASYGRYGAHRKYFVKFEAEPNRTRHEFEVPYQVFDQLRPGNRGRLRYRTWEFISFHEMKESA